jgi:dTDP-glucose 4,6-dehydratase
MHYRNVLITGGCGFIGSNFVRYFYHHRPKSRIVNLDLLTYAGNLENLADIEKLEQKLPKIERRYRFRQGDICDQNLLDELFEKHRFDLVIHFAAESHVDRSIFNMSEFVRTNIEGTRVLIEAARRNGMKRFINISTDEVYGSIKGGYASEEWPLTPSNPYSASKAGADLLVQAYIRTHDFPAVIIRGSNNYGPYQYPEKLIPLAVTNLLEGKKIPIHGHGLHVRNWLHVYDFCRAIDTITHGDARHRIYNVAGEEKTNQAVLQAITRTLGKNLYDCCFHVSDRPGADLRYAPDASRLADEFGWRRIHNFEAEINKVVQWYVDQSDWWRRIRLKKGFMEHYERQSKGQWC